MSDIYTFGPFVFDRHRRLLKKRDREIGLTPKEEMLLLALLDARGALVSHEDLHKRLWPGESKEACNLPFQIHCLRKKLDDDEAGRSYIANVTGRGFRLEPAISSIEPVPAKAAPDVSAGPAVGWWRSGRRRIYASAYFGLCFVTLLFALRSVSKSDALRLSCCAQVTHDGLPKMYPFLATDGTRLYFGESVGTRHVAASVSVEGGEVSRLSNVPEQFELLSLSPQGNQLIALASEPTHFEQDLWEVPLPAGSPRRIGDFTASAATWSPDGRSIAFVHQRAIYISNASGSEVRKIADLPGLGLQLQWSPDARRIRFVLAQDGQPGTTLWEVGLGGSPQPILKGWDGEGQIASPGGWSPDGRNSFFVSPHLGTYDIWDLPEQSIFNFGKRYPSRISDVPFVIMGIVPSRDGKKLFAIGIHTMPEVGRFDPRVGQFLPYQEFSGIHAYWITFSRNHRQVAYTTYPEENLWIENADGTDRTQLTFAPLHVVGLSWSPDGSRIAFRAQTPGGHWKVYVMSVSGKELRELTAGQSDSGVPTWSPDGRRLVFGDMPAVWGQARGDEVLHLYDLRSGTTSALSGSGGLWTSRWSPDGKFIAALKISNQELMLYDCHSGRWRSLGPAGLNEVMWSHDSKFLMYETLRPDVAIYRIQIANGKTERLCDLAAYARLEQGFTLDSDDHPIVLQNKSTSEIYAFGIESH